MKLYYAHAMPLYGTATDASDRRAIKKRFPKHTIVDPRRHASKDPDARSMDYWFSLIDGCDALVYTLYLDKVTSGVGKEANHALARGMEVFELRDGSFRRVSKRVKYMSQSETQKLYIRHGFMPPELDR